MTLRREMGPVAKSFLALGMAWLALAVLWGAACASAPQFDLPLDCDMQTDCFIQQYFDADPGSGYKDYACGRLSYDGHTGTDFRVRDLVHMDEGVPVLAAAPGTVRAIRDGMDDVSVRETGTASLDGRFAGNSVVVSHGGGVETQYSHLRKGSVRVRKGQKVRAGTILGLVGLSGRTEFPHLEFSVRVDGRPVDPFKGLAGGPPCGPGEAPLWSPQALRLLAYEPTRLLGSGFASRPPSHEEVAHRLLEQSVFPVDSEALVYWIRVAGLLEGDVLEFSLSGPEGELLARHEQLMDRSKVQFFQYVGSRRGADRWPAGVYTGRFVLRRLGPRDAAVIIDTSSRAMVGN